MATLQEGRSQPMNSGEPIPGQGKSEQGKALAVIGLACRFPKDAKNIESLWQCLLEGRSLATRIPRRAFDPDGFYHPDPDRGGTIITDVGHFLADGTESFDAPFFSLSKSEITSMDPQQRMMLENTYQALENAGLRMENIARTATSVFIGGGFAQDYLHSMNQDTEMMIKGKGTGTSTALLSNRVSWFYDLRGTSMTIDTACSSSLVALHQACQDIRSGQSETAIVGGVNIIQFPGTMLALGDLGVLSPDGKCYSFDHRANGYGRGEGVGTLIIKRLDAALRDKNTIRAIIRATGSNQDGKTPGIALPSMAAQERLIRQVYTKAGLDMGLTRYVEAHGTGTAAGDPIEAGAIAAAFDSVSTHSQPVYIGSIKGNIGHLESAAGIAGVIKAILMVEKGIIPPAANFEEVNPKIPLEKWNLKIATRLVEWPPGVRRVSVNSFGFGGTNAHAVIDDVGSFLLEFDNDGEPASPLTHTEEGPPTPDSANLSQPNGEHHEDILGVSLSNRNYHTLLNGDGTSQPINSTLLHGACRAGMETHHRVFICSTPDEAGIRINASKLAEHLHKLPVETCNQHYLHDLAYTLAAKRSVFKWKAFCIAENRSGLISELESGMSKPIQKSRQAPKLGFVFTGQGAQWTFMGRAMAIYPLFHESIEEASAHMTLFGSPWSLKEVLFDPKSSSADMNDPFLSQAACAAVQIALVDLLASWNIHPSRVLGHSSGEIAAAYCAGHLTRRDAWKVAYFRGYVSAAQSSRKGGMAAVGISAEGIMPYLKALEGEVLKAPGELVIACHNSPKNITISGDETQVDLLCAALEKDNIFARKLAVRNAYHSRHMEVAADHYLELIGELSNAGSSRRVPQVEMVSSVTGKLVKPGEVSEASYWIENLLKPVRFSDALLIMAASQQTEVGHRRLRIRGRSDRVSIQHIIEIGPHSALRTAIKDTLSTTKETNPIIYHGVLTRNVDDNRTVLSTVATLYCHSYPVDIEAVNCHNDSRLGSRAPNMLTDLPPYEFNHTNSYWKESRLSKNFRQRHVPRHDLFGAPVADWDPVEPRWRGFLRISELPWLNDHKITGNHIFPGVGYLVMAIEASKQLADEVREIVGFSLKDICLKSALHIPDTPDGIEYVLSMKEKTESNRDRSTLWREFRVSSCSSDGEHWTEHCSGLIMTEIVIGVSEVDNGYESIAESQINSHILEKAESMCQGKVGTNYTYEAWREIGLEFGPTFRNISQIKLGDGHGHSLSTVTIPDVAGIMPKGFLHPHTIQPATLDSILQTFMMAIVDIRREEILRRPELPTFVKNFWVSASISTDPGTKFKCYSRAEQVSPTQYVTSIASWDDNTRMLKVKISGIQTKPLETAISSSIGTTDHLCYFIEWQPDVDLLSKGTSVFQDMLPQQNFDSKARRAHLKRCQLISMLYIQEAMDATADLDPSLLKIHQRKYLNWLRCQGTKISTPGACRLQDSALLEQMRQKLSEPAQQPTAREELLHILGPQMKPIICGEVDALELMFGNGDLMDRFYTETSSPGNITPLLQSFLKALGHNLPRLKIIEIGAGTGSTTSSILELLSPAPTVSLGDDRESSSSRIASYTYTDVSAGFFKNAKEKFGNWAGLMEFKMLNIESSPMIQGFDEGTYDLVIASNVLHATSCLVGTLKNVRSLLKSGGKLILVEIVQPEFLFNSLCFGLLPGWWLSSEPFRADGPLMIGAHWERMLRDNGFSGLDIELKDTDDEELHEISVMISSAESTDHYINGMEKRLDVYLICESLEQAKEQLTLSIRDHLVERGLENCMLIDYHELPSTEVDLTGGLCVSLIGLGKTDLSVIEDKEFSSIQSLLLSSSTLIWVSANETHKPELAMATGLIRSVRWERDFDSPNLVTLSIENPCPEPRILAHKILQCIDPRRNARNEEFLYKEHELWVPRVRESARTTRYLNMKAGLDEPSPQIVGENRSIRLTTKSPGLLNKLVFENEPVWRKDLEGNEVEVRIHASGVNFMDVMIAMGQITKMSMGIEGSGEITRVGSNVRQFAVGDQVICFASQKERGCFQNFFRANETAVIKVPPGISMDAAAAIPLVFMTVVYSLNHVARLSAGETVLVHAAAGGVGQAAIQLAQIAGAEIFATVSTVEKRAWLIDEYGLAEDHIFSSRDLSFVKGIKRMTQDRGVDIVLNSLSGEALHQSWKCVAPFGRFIELGKKDILTNGNLSMEPFLNNITYSAVDIKAIMELKPEFAAALVREVLHLFEQGKLRVPSPLTTYSFANAETAFRKLQTGQAMGKTILKPHIDDIVQLLPEKMVPFRFDPDVSYVLAGGLGGIGRSLARWMHSRDAKNFIFLSRSGGISKDAQVLIEDLEKASCRVRVCVCDVGNDAQLRESIEACKSNMPPIKGCIQGSMVLEDSMFVNMTYEQFQAAVGPKVRGTRNLHAILGDDLDFFVMLSSITSIVGNRGQANYAAGNAYQDALAMQLVSKGIKAASINLGTIKTVGYIAENRERMQRQGGIATQWAGMSEDELHSVIEYHIDPRIDFNRGGFRFQSIAGLMTASAITKKGAPIPAFMNYPLFMQLYAVDLSAVAINNESEFPIQKLLSSCDSLEAAAKLVEEALQIQLLNMMSVLKEEFDPHKPLVAYGIDSLIAVEIRTWISKSMGADVAIFDILGRDSIVDFSAKIAALSSLVRFQRLEVGRT